MKTGPCGGKSTCLDAMTTTLRKLNVEVYTIPEVPTILISNGAVYPGLSLGDDVLLNYESNMIDLQIKVEDAFHSIAESRGRPSVIICDRGSLDVAAYLPTDLWQRTLANTGHTKESLTSRYDFVIHLVTAADGAEEFYTTANNIARTETAEEARNLDLRSQSCWSHHPNYLVIHNTTGGFQAKMETALAFMTSEMSKLLKISP